MIIYVILFSLFIGITLSFFAIKYKVIKKNENKIRFNDYFIKILAGVALIFIFVRTFLQPGEMISIQVDDYTFSGGCINLIGSPYGNNKAGNFFAWLQITLFYPSAFAVCLLPFFDYKGSKYLLNYILMPIIILNALLFFNLSYAICGDVFLAPDTILLAIEVGLITGLTSVIFINRFISRNIEPINKYELFKTILVFIAFVLLFIPSYSLSTLFPANMEFGSKAISLQHATNFSPIHRFSLYMTAIFCVFVFAVLKNKNKELKKYALIMICVSGIFSFFISHNINNTIYKNPMITYVGRMYFNVNNLPIDILNIALILIAISLVFNKKTLFNILFLIVLPINFIYIFFPRMASYTHFFNYEARSYYQLIIRSFLCISFMAGFKLYEFPKIKEFKKSSIAFVGYFLFIIICNAWLSNYIAGYHPNIVMSGTNFFNTNGDSLIKIFGKGAENIFNFKFVITIGAYRFRFYYLYHLIYLIALAALISLGYILNIQFAKVGTAHSLLSQKLKIKNQSKINKQDDSHEKVALEISHLYKKYKGNDFYSLTDITLNIKKGEIVGLLGHNGAGKSTLIKSIVGQEEFDSGDVRAFGIVNEEYPRLFKETVGYIPDHYILYEDLTGREFVNYIADLYHVSKVTRRKNILYYLKLFKLTNSFDAKIETYSFGMKQKIAIMTTLIHEPKIWLLDEPLTGLDPESIYQIKRCIIEHAKKGNVVLFSSHLIDIVEEISTQIVILKKGKLVYQENTKVAKKKYDNHLEQLYMDKVGANN